MKNVICSIDDSDYIPNAIQNLLSMPSKQKIDFYFIQMGNKESVGYTDEIIDILDEIEKGNWKSPPLDIVGAVKTIQAIDKTKAKILFACDLVLEDIEFPGECNDAKEYKTNILNKSKEEYTFQVTKGLDAGIYLIHKLQHDFDYVLTSRVSLGALRLNDIGINRRPLDRAIGITESSVIARIVRKSFIKKYYTKATWCKLLNENRSLLQDLLSGMVGKDKNSGWLWRRGAHDLQDIIKKSEDIDESFPEAIPDCENALKTLDLVDVDIEFARESIRSFEDDSLRAYSIAKTVAVLRRIEKVYVFDLLDYVWKKKNHQVFINEKELQNYSNLLQIVHDNLQIPSQKACELFKLFDKKEISFIHEIRNKGTSIDPKDNLQKEILEYQLSIMFKKTKPHALNLTKLQNVNSKNVGSYFQLIKELFDSKEIKLAIINGDFERFKQEIPSLLPNEFYILLKRSDYEYKLGFIGIKEFKIGVTT